MVSSKRDQARSIASGRKKLALVWIPLGPVFALLADWPVGLLLIPASWGLAATLWWFANLEERFLLKMFSRFGEHHPSTSWTALGNRIRTKMRRG